MHANSLHLGHLHFHLLSVFLAGGLIAAVFLGRKVAPLAGLERDAMWNASVLAGFCGVVSFRLLSVVMSPARVSGQMGSSGSLWAAVLSAAVAMGAVSLRLRGQGIQVVRFLDASAPGLALLAAFVGVGSFFGGRSGAPTGVRWGVADPGLGRVHPVEIYAALAALCLSFWLWRALLFAAGHGGRPGRTFFTGVFAAGGLMFFLDFAARPDGGGGAASLDQVQWLGLAMVVFGFLMLRRPVPANSVSASCLERDSHAL